MEIVVNADDYLRLPGAQRRALSSWLFGAPVGIERVRRIKVATHEYPTQVELDVVLLDAGYNPVLDDIGRERTTTVTYESSVPFPADVADELTALRAGVPPRGGWWACR